MAETRQGSGTWRPGQVYACGLGALLLLSAAYAAGPFIALWRICHAITTGDTATLHAVIDWSAVRQGLKDDIADGIIGMPQQTLVASNTLPPFGASFISGIAASAIDRAVSPQALVEASRLLAPIDLSMGASSSGGLAWPSIVEASFASPSRFDMNVRAPCQEADEAPLHIRLAFRNGAWTVIRVWIPQDLMDRAGTRT